MLADGSVYPHPGKVLWTDRQVDPSTGTIRVAAAFPTPATFCGPANTAECGRLRKHAATRLLVPQAAVTELQGTFQAAVVGERQ